VRFLAKPHGRNADTDSEEARNHRDLVPPEARSLRLWLGRRLKGEDAEGEARNSKGVQGRVESEPGKALRVIGQDDGPR